MTSVAVAPHLIDFETILVLATTALLCAQAGALVWHRSSIVGFRRFRPDTLVLQANGDERR